MPAAGGAAGAAISPRGRVARWCGQPQRAEYRRRRHCYHLIADEATNGLHSLIVRAAAGRRGITGALTVATVRAAAPD